MDCLNIEIKARCGDQDSVREILRSRNARFIGEDHQVDTYFNVESGRLKLREGNIENSLICYNREDTEGPKQSNVVLFRTEPNSPLKEILTKSLGIKVVVDKRREIYFIDNVKFHIDLVEGLGTFVEIEAIDEDGQIGKEKLQEQCHTWMNLFGISKDDLLAVSYSDLLQALKGSV